MSFVNRKEYKEKTYGGAQPFILLCFELFFIVFAIHIRGFEGLFTLRNLSIGYVIAFSILFFHNKRNSTINAGNTDKKWIASMLFFFLYCVIVVFLNGVSFSDSHNVFRGTFAFMVMVVMLPYFLLKIENKRERMAVAMIIITTIQSLIVIGCFLNPSIKSFIFEIQQWDEEWLYYRVSGLGIAGAGGTVYLFCGFLANCYYLVFFRRNVLWFITLVIIFFSTMLVGRTGFYMEVVMAVYTFVQIWKQTTPHKSSFLTFLSLLVASMVLVVGVKYIQSNVEVDYDMINSSYNRLNDIVEGSTVSTIQAMAVPSLNTKTLLWGTGLTKGKTFDGTLIWHDSGYVQWYNAFGLIPAIFMYMNIFLYMFFMLKKIKDLRIRIFWLLPVVMLFVIEYKEDFIFYLALPFVLIVFLKLELYAQSIKETTTANCLFK